MGTSASFPTVIAAVGNNAAIEVPPEVLETLGAGKRPALRVAVGDYTWESSVGTMAGRHLVSLSKAHREASGLAPGQAVDVRVEVVDGPREVAVPDALQSALAEHDLVEAFTRLSFSARKEHARQVADAKTDATRERRVAKVLDALR